MNFPILDSVSKQLSAAIVTPAERIAQGSLVGALSGLGVGVVLVSFTGALGRARGRRGDLWLWSTAVTAPVIGMLFGQYIASQKASGELEP